MGGSAGEAMDGGNQNTMVGFRSGLLQSTGDGNTYLGEESGGNKTGGSKNAFLGFQTGQNNGTGNRNVFLGYQAGKNETGDDKLYIDNSDTTAPLIYGEFDTDFLKINGTLGVQQGFADTDKDTKIQVEEGTDDDQVRFDIAGEEKLVLKKNVNGILMIETQNNEGNTIIGKMQGSTPIQAWD